MPARVTSGLGLRVAHFGCWGGLGRLVLPAGGPGRPVGWFSVRLGRVGMPGSSGTPLWVTWTAGEGLEARGWPW